MFELLNPSNPLAAFVVFVVSFVAMYTSTRVTISPVTRSRSKTK